MIVTALTSISKTTCQLITRHGGVIVKVISTIPPDIVAEDGHVQNQQQSLNMVVLGPC